ncbi:hypothetical protein B0H16DRAFT_1595748 [Mycena metata]|uniref:Ricin B lectin domain-containing protein n=1 Tax=Mycena metata TaxID=1033252 RepID=A0AAD7MKT2_9AGAR|nr:hypothetical protein B0H16DRAFT_1602994 [Mycena metata]KAJ7724788.1 hypothetical protein B0H16DRAFT_1595748 [Mycena metata]
MKFVSLVVLATRLFTAVGASAVAPRASPDPDAAIANVIIQPLLNSRLCPLVNSSLCITATGTSLTSPTILAPCNNLLSQLWSVNSVTGNVVQFQNVGNSLCFAELTAPPFNGLAVTIEPCLQTNGAAFSGTLFDASQTITQSKLPLVVTALNSRVGSTTDTGFCLDQTGNSLVINGCSGSLTQSWLLSSL